MQGHPHYTDDRTDFELTTFYDEFAEHDDAVEVYRFWEQTDTR
ncbi:hypothetical protein [Nocardia terpenica]